MIANVLFGGSARVGEDLRGSTRPRRVTVVLLAIVILSAADLAVTVVYLKTTGMMEANPIAALLIEHTRSAWVLAAYKIATVGLAVSVLYRLRRHAAGEIAAWCGLAALVVVAFMWSGYSKAMEETGSLQLAQFGLHDDQWLALD